MALAQQTVADVCLAARDASRILAGVDTSTRDAALHAIADALEERVAEILEANARDLEAGRESGLSSALMDRLALDAARRDPGSFLAKRLSAHGEVTGHDCVDGAKEGDEASRRCLRILAERLGIGIANAINLYDPLEVVIGGGVSTAGDLLLEPANRVAFRHVLPGVGTRTKIRLARHGPRAGVLGAALIAAQEWELDSKEGGS